MQSVDIIDILFLVMASFGFYFGYTYGFIRVFLAAISLSLASLAAMICTPILTRLLVEVLQLQSPYIPFLACLGCVVVALLMIRIVTKLIEEKVQTNKVNVLSKLLGAGLMTLIFTVFYAVLVTFFGKAGVIQLVFNQDYKLKLSESEVRLSVAGATKLPTDTIQLSNNTHAIQYNFIGALHIGNHKYRSGHSVGIKALDTTILFYPHQQFIFSAAAPLQLTQTTSNTLLCFCNSAYKVSLQEDFLWFDCTDKSIKGIREGSLLYDKIQLVPEKGAQLMQGFIPVADAFVDFMRVALSKLEEQSAQ